MRISIALILVVTAVAVIGRPHNDGTDHTHSPVIAPDSESVINIEGHNEAAVHHSDVDMGNFTKSGQTDLSHIVSASTKIAAAETHHSDTYMMSATSKKPLVGPGHAPTIHVNADKTSENQGLEGKLDSVVSHGPMAKNMDHHDKHDHEHEHGRHGHHDKHSTVHHAPMATEHHHGNAHHPQLSKTEPAIAHAPMAHPDNTETDRPDDSINEHSVTSTVNHPPLATDHHSPNYATMLAHHPSLSKIDPPLAHAPIAIPHGSEKEGEGSRKKRSGHSNEETIEEYQDSKESPLKEAIREKRSKGSNQKSYARKTTTTTTTTTIAAPTKESTESAEATVTARDSSVEHGSEEEESEPAVREKRSKGSQQKTVKRATTTTTTTTTPATTTLIPGPTTKEVFEASHRGSSEEQDSNEQGDKKPEESEFREKRSKGSNRKPAAYIKTTTTTTVAPKTKESEPPTVASVPESHEHHEEEESQESHREKRSKGSNQKSYARKTTTSTTTTTVAPTQESSVSSLESSEDPHSHLHEKPEETVVRSKRSKGGGNSFAKKPLTTRNYPTITSTTAAATTQDDVTASLSDVSDGDLTESDEIIVREKRSKGSYQKTQPRKTTTTTTTAKPTTTTIAGVSEAVSIEDSSSIEDLEVTSEKIVRDKRAKGSQNYAKKNPTTTTTKAPEPEVPASNVHHPSLSKTEPLNPAKPEEPKNTKPEIGSPTPAPESTKKDQPPQIIPGSHPLAIPLPTNPPPS